MKEQELKIWYLNSKSHLPLKIFKYVFYKTIFQDVIFNLMITLIQEYSFKMFDQ